MDKKGEKEFSTAEAFEGEHHKEEGEQVFDTAVLGDGEGGHHAENGNGDAAAHSTTEVAATGAFKSERKSIIGRTLTKEEADELKSKA